MSNPPSNMVSFKDEAVDVCIIGSGAGGAPLAHELSKAGLKVLVLEKGPWYQRTDFDHDEIKNARRNYWAPYVSDEPHMLKYANDAAAQPTNEGWTSNCVGGGTVHMSGFFYRLHPADFQMQTRYPEVSGTTLADWPITYADLAPYYDRAEAAVGVSGVAAKAKYAPPRAGDFPHPPLATNPLAALVDKGGAKVGLNVYQTPRAILSRAVDGREACVYCDFCGSYGCESGAKGSALEAFVTPSLASGKCEIRPHCMVHAFETRSDGGISAARYYAKDGSESVVKARVFVVSATAIESARLLLNHSSTAHPNGLANSSGLVGKNLTFSTLGKGIGEFDAESLDEAMRPHHPIHFINRSISDLYFLDAFEGEYNKGGTIGFLLPHRNPIFTADRISKKFSPPLWGAALQRQIKSTYDDLRELEFEVYGEFAANPLTYVDIHPEKKDRWGIPVAQMHVFNHALDVRNNLKVVEAGIDVLKAAGAQNTRQETVGGTTFILQHGTCRMGVDPKASVLNADCQSHDVKNLFVVDGSFMPSSGGVPTTLTIMANSLRVADRLIERLKSGEFE
ncbi:MAG: GMC family oxidoreductase [bacterium]